MVTGLLTKERNMQRSKQRKTIAHILLAILCGCHGADVGERLQVETLPGNDFYRTAGMDRPRYEHEAKTLDDGTVLVVAGTDERGLTTIESCEIYDQKLMVEPQPPSISGGWITTDFEGNPLQLEGGGRIFHTAVGVDNGNVMVHQGVREIQMSEVVVHPEFYDRTTRTFTEVSASFREPRFHGSIIEISDGETIFFGGQIHVDTTLVNDMYPPNDPRYFEDIDTYPSTPCVERYDSSLDSEDGFGNFAIVTDTNGSAVEMVTSLQGRAMHKTVRLAGLDNSVGSRGDIFVHAGGIKTLSELFAPQDIRRRAGDGGSEMVPDLEVYDGFTNVSFILSSMALRYARTHEVQAENLGWYSSRTFDGINGLSNVFMVYGGSTDTLATTGRFFCEGFCASYSGFGPGNGIQLLRTEFEAGETIESVIQNTIGAGVSTELVETMELIWESTPLMWAVQAFEPLPCELIRAGKYFGMEACFEVDVLEDWIIEPPEVPPDSEPEEIYQAALRDSPVNRVHTGTAHLYRSVQTDFGTLELGNLFTAGGAFVYPVLGGQFQQLDEPLIACGEYFDPFYNLINAYYGTQHNPYDLATVRNYWSIRNSIPLPEPALDNREHPNPTGSHGAWLITDGFLAEDGFEGYQWLPPYTQDPDNYEMRFLEKGRFMHTMTILPGEDGKLYTIDDRVLFAGGGNDITLGGGSAVVPSAEIYVPNTVNDDAL